jgi:hypothetical protein
MPKRKNSMQTLQITEPEKMVKILETFAKLDEIRWNTFTNYNLVNYCRNDLSADEKLLTHYLSYIMDRQMPFQRIWDIGGYVISHLVRAFKSNPNASVHDIAYGYIKQNKKVYLECPCVRPNNRLASYGINGETVQFRSRYMPEDAVLIYRTLLVLDKTSDRSLARFMDKAVGNETDIAKGIRKMACAMDKMTYSVAGAVSVSNFSKRMEHESATISEFNLDNSFKENLFGCKRLWCSLRDYLKSPEFNEVFISALNEVNAKNCKMWSRPNSALQSALNVLELPGDIWNNSEIFREGLFRPYLANERKSWDMPRTIRKIYNILSKSPGLQFYPEQLDVSFDFVPLMCERDRCDVCFFGAGVSKTCHQKAKVLCPIVLYSCGYRYSCEPDTCNFKSDCVKGYCKGFTRK